MSSRTLAPTALPATPGQALSAALQLGRRALRQLAARAGLGSIGLLVLLLAWQLGAWALQARIPMADLFAPRAAFASLYQLLASGELGADIVASLRRVGVSLALALAAGIPIGLAVGSWRRFDAASSSAFQLLRMISPLSWMPIAVMTLGIGDAPIYFLLAITAVWPVALNTAAGVRAMNRQWLQLGASLSATRWEMLTRIIVPAITGHVLTGLRLAIGMIWILLVPCEMLGVTSGLGYFVLDTRDRLAYSELMAVVLFIGLLGWLLDSAAQSLHRYWVRG